MLHRRLLLVLLFKLFSFAGLASLHRHMFLLFLRCVLILLLLNASFCFPVCLVCLFALLAFSSLFSVSFFLV